MVRETIQSIGHDLARSPIALALVIINVAFLATGLYLLRDIGHAVERKDALLAQLINEHCIAKEAKP